MPGKRERAWNSGANAGEIQLYALRDGNSLRLGRLKMVIY